MAFVRYEDSPVVAGHRAVEVSSAAAGLPVERRSVRYGRSMNHLKRHLQAGLHCSLVHGHYGTEEHSDICLPTKTAINGSLLSDKHLTIFFSLSG